MGARGAKDHPPASRAWPAPTLGDWAGQSVRPSQADQSLVSCSVMASPSGLGTWFAVAFSIRFYELNDKTSPRRSMNHWRCGPSRTATGARSRAAPGNAASPQQDRNRLNSSRMGAEIPPETTHRTPCVEYAVAGGGLIAFLGDRCLRPRPISSFHTQSYGPSRPAPVAAGMKDLSHLRGASRCACISSSRLQVSPAGGWPCSETKTAGCAVVSPAPPMVVLPAASACRPESSRQLQRALKSCRSPKVNCGPQAMSAI